MANILPASCSVARDSQRHTIVCPAIFRKRTNEELKLINQLNYSFLVGSIKEQLHKTIIYQRIIAVRAAASQTGPQAPPVGQLPAHKLPWAPVASANHQALRDGKNTQTCTNFGCRYPGLQPKKFFSISSALAG